ncbi:M20/M25/M40 family metallo-hydrolase [Solimonas marina]|uniref:M20/M25/M40 family metallo-hydrolase n=1 Tax=Solimonas marina TaxID=2714601 RepID=A0A969WDT7_9GAMM|nr:M20/M25/M40 family metallo-hydrolase [Solimonas marina]NKF24235.1 M20/M25/M40 family metallo-hydrolase [Solimonas marina]
MTSAATPLSDLQAAVVAAVDASFDESCAFLAELVRVPSDNPPGDCAAHAARAKALLEAMGYAVEADGVPQAEVEAVGMIAATNLIVRQAFAAGGPCIAMNAHGDVVPPGLGWTEDPYGGTVREDATFGPTMYGRGVAVSKSDFATYTFALRALQKIAASHPLKGSVELHFTYDEETGGDIGPRRLLEQGISKPDYVLSAGFSYAVTTAHNGCLHLEVTVHGKQGHAAMPSSGVDALEAANKMLNVLYAMRAEIAKTRSQTPGISHPTLNIGLIRGGINTNVVPDLVSFRLDRRIIPEESFDAVETELRALIRDTAATLPGIRVEVRRVLQALPLVKLPGAEKMTESLQRNGEALFGTPIIEHGVPLYTDARHYTAAGIPTVLYGAGPRTLGEANGHAADEKLRLNDLKRATAVVACMLAEMLAA